MGEWGGWRRCGRPPVAVVLAASGWASAKTAVRRLGSRIPLTPERGRAPVVTAGQGLRPPHGNGGGHNASVHPSVRPYLIAV
jgi:hypothetical protein